MKLIRVKLSKRGGKVWNASRSCFMEPGKVYEVPYAPYWARRLKDKAVVEVKDSAPKTPKFGKADK